MQSIARDSDDSSDEEFFDAPGNQSFYLFLFLFDFDSMLKKTLLLPIFSYSACISLTTDQFLNFSDTQHALGLQLK